MKKVIFKVILFSAVILLFFSNTSYVSAESYGGNQLIYNITSLQISGGTLDFEGFVFIDHRDNFGGENLRAWIIAKGSGAASQPYEVDFYDRIDGGVGGFDYYYVRCQQSASGVGSDYCSSDHALAIRNAHGSRNNCNTKDYADCAYFNVNFKVSISINDLIKKFGTKGEIRFDIEASNGITITKPLGVHQSNCSGSSGVPGSCNGEILTDNGKITVSELSNTVRVTTTKGKIRYFPSTAYANGHYSYGQTLGASSFNKGRTFLKHGNTFSSNIYLVDGTSYLVFDSWVEAVGEIVIKFEDVEEVPSDAWCDPGYNQNYETKSIVCGSNAEFKGCVAEGVSFSSEYPLTSGEMNALKKPDGSGELCNDDLADGYADVAVSFKALVHERGLFTFGGGGRAIAGRGFAFPTLNYQNEIYWLFKGHRQGSIKYTANAELCSWSSEHHSVCEDPQADGSCKSWKHWTTYKKVSHTFKVPLDKVMKSGRQLIYEMNDNGKGVVKNTIRTTPDSVISASTPSSYDSNVVSYNLGAVAGNWDSGAGEWWNGTINEDILLGGRYQIDYNFQMLPSYVSRENPDALVSYGSCGSDKGCFGPFASKYFVPLRYPDGKNFKIVVGGNDISFIEKIHWFLDGDCNIGVTNKMYDCTGDGCEPKYVYRPIDLSDTFPDGQIPVNWRAWWENNDNQNRLKKTYSNGLFYDITLINGNSRDKYLGTGVVDKYNDKNDYNNWNNIIVNSGTSEYILDNSHYYNTYKRGKTSHCPIGIFNASCDEYN